MVGQEEGAGLIHTLLHFLVSFPRSDNLFFRILRIIGAFCNFRIILRSQHYRTVCPQISFRKQVFYYALPDFQNQEAHILPGQYIIHPPDYRHSAVCIGLVRVLPVFRQKFAFPQPYLTVSCHNLSIVVGCLEFFICAGIKNNLCVRTDIFSPVNRDKISVFHIGVRSEQ